MSIWGTVYHCGRPVHGRLRRVRVQRTVRRAGDHGPRPDGGGVVWRLPGADALFGLAAGGALSGFISSVDHWIAFALLVLLGINMIREARCPDEDDTNAPWPSG